MTEAFSVSTYADLCKVGTGVDGWTLSADYVQTADIQCPAGSNFPRIGLDPGTLFTGTYDGNGYEIQNLRLHYSDFHTGMFIVIGETGIVQNVTLVDVDVSGTSSRTGALAGLVLGTVRNCHSSGTVVGAALTGGLIGVLGEYMGTDVGYLESSSSSCTVTITGQYSTDQGGLVGSMLSGSMVECSATGDVIDGSIAGGLIGIAEGGTISVSRCSAAGNVTAPDDCWSGTGGLIGKMSGSVSVTDCYAAGGVSAPSRVGGLIGNRVGGTISSCYATGQVAATDEYGTAGGLIGGGGGTSSSFWDTETSGQATSDGGVGKTTAELQTLATFADWDIATHIDYTDEVWYIVPGEDYPRLAWEGVPAYDDTIDHYRGFRGDKHGSGRYDSVATTDGTPAWNYSTGDTVYTTPVIGPNGNIVFRGTSGKVYSITQTGTLGWEYPAAGDDYLTGTVAIDTSGAIYFGDYSGVTGPRFCSLTSGGALRWETSQASYGGPYEQSPVISNGLVYLKPYTSVLAHTCDGGIGWSTPYRGSGNNYDGLAVGIDGTIIASPSNSGKISAYAPVTGSLLWESDLIQPLESGKAHSDGVPAVSPETGVIYTTGRYFTGYPYVRYNGVVATSPAGSRLWVSPEDPAGNSPSECASLAVGQEAVYSVWDDGSLRAHDLETGEQIWSRPGSFYAEPYDPVAEGCRAVPSPVLDGNDTVFIGGTDGYFYAITSSGDELWRYNLGTGNINSATIGNDGTVYVTTQSGDLYAFPLPDKLPYPIAVRDAHSFLMRGTAVPIPGAVVTYSGVRSVAGPDGVATIDVERNLAGDAMITISVIAKSCAITTKSVRKSDLEDGVTILLLPMNTYSG